MAIPFRQIIKVGSYVVAKHLTGNKRYPLVLMLEPLFRCNLACSGCGKIDYPDPILNKRLSIDECAKAVDECGAPIVSIAGGEPLLHHEIDQIVNAIIARGKFVYLCSNALLMEKKIHLFEPSPFFTWQVHLDGGREEHDRSVDLPGTYDRAIAAIKNAKKRGFRVNINCTLYSNAEPDKVAAFLDEVKAIGVDGVTVSPGYAYERAPVTSHFLNHRKTKTLFREILRRGKGRKWNFIQSSLFLDFLAGNQSYGCTPWGNPTRNVLGWQRPCYLLNEGYAPSFNALMAETDWGAYGTGNYEKCADCMVHSGYEASAVMDTISHPLKALKVALFGPRLEGDMAEEIPLDNQRPAEDVHARIIEDGLKSINTTAQTR